MYNGSAACMNCSQNTYSVTIGASSDATCSLCPVNTNSPTGSSEKVMCRCNPGWTGPDGGPCEKCEVGTYKPASGSAPCTMCAVNYYGSTQAAISPLSCLPCPLNSTSVAGSPNISSCACNLGYEQSTDHATCTQCTKGKYDPSNNRYACSSCPGGKYSDNPGTIGQENCKTCPSGKYSMDTAANCELCPLNSNSSAGSTFITECTCIAGTTGSNGQTCTLCDAGKYKASTGSGACIACPMATNSLVGSDAESDCGCPAGYLRKPPLCTDGAFSYPIYFDTYLVFTMTCATMREFPNNCLTAAQDINGNWGQPGIDPAGNVAAENCCACGGGVTDTADGPCEVCAAGKYSTNVDSIGCTACPDSTTSLEGSDELTDCVCKAGFTASAGGTGCTACALGKTKTVAGPGPCMDCAAGKYKAFEGFGDCSTCLEKSEPNAETGATDCVCEKGHALTYESTYSACEPCAVGEYDDIYPERRISCKLCPLRSSTVGTGSYGISTCLCMPGYRHREGDCEGCPIGTYKASLSSTDDCTSCSPGGTTLYMDSLHPSQCVAKPGYTHTAENTFEACPVNTYKTSTGNSPCTPCFFGSVTNDVGNTKASDCSCVAEGYQDKDITFGIPRCGCQAGFYEVETGGDFRCLACTENFWCPGDGARLPCESNQVSVSGSSKTTDCKCIQGYTSDGVYCEACIAGKYKDILGTAPCSNCPSYSSSPSASTNINACVCSAGSYGSNGGLCTACSENTYKTTTGPGTCVSCPENSFSPQYSDQLSDCKCNRGYFGPDGGQCTICATGTYKSSIDSQACTTCPSPDTRTSLAGSDDESDCVCKPGFTGWNCLQCVKGTYKNMAGNDACTDCGMGKYSATEGAIECSNCPVYSVTLEPKRTSRTDCKCDYGATGPDGGECKQCVAGKYKPGLGTNACSSCAPGKYLETTGERFVSACVSCELSTSPEASSSKADCICNAGSTGSGGVCTQCVAGTYKAVPGNASCTDCVRGKYRSAPGASAESQCAACPLFSSTNLAGRTSVLECTCNAGATGPDGLPCTQCPAGQFKTSTGTGACTNCGRGKYSTTVGATEITRCLSCPEWSSSPSGSATDVSCVCDAGATPS